jgi:hypothetical protein
MQTVGPKRWRRPHNWASSCCNMRVARLRRVALIINCSTPPVARPLRKLVITILERLPTLTEKPNPSRPKPVAFWLGETSYHGGGRDEGMRVEVDSNEVHSLSMPRRFRMDGRVVEVVLTMYASPEAQTSRHNPGSTCVPTGNRGNQYLKALCRKPTPRLRLSHGSEITVARLRCSYEPIEASSFGATRRHSMVRFP